MRRRRALDTGFVLSDHADWLGLLGVIAATGAGDIVVTHGYSTVVERWLREQGVQASVIPTAFEGELEEAERRDDADVPPKDDSQ